MAPGCAPQARPAYSSAAPSTNQCRIQPTPPPPPTSFPFLCPPASFSFSQSKRFTGSNLEVRANFSPASCLSACLMALKSICSHPSHPQAACPSHVGARTRHRVLQPLGWSADDALHEQGGMLLPRVETVLTASPKERCPWVQAYTLFYSI